MFNLFQKVWTLVIGLLCCGLTYALFAAGHGVLALLMVVVTLVSVYIFVAPRAYAYRYMYPGLITFLFFMLLPTIFIVVIGFTNLGTGHLMSQHNVFRQLLDETVVTDNFPERRFELVQTPAARPDQLEVLVQQGGEDTLYDQWLYAQISARHTLHADKQIALRPLQQAMPAMPIAQIAVLGKKRIYQALEELKFYQFVTPEHEVFRVTKIGAMADLRFVALPDEKLRDVHTGAVYYPDTARGYYTDGKEDLTGGFYVGVGFKNYTALVTSPGLKESFFKIFTWSFVWALMSVILTFSVGMLLSLIVNGKQMKGKMIYRILLIIPYAVPAFISVLIFKGLLNQEFGVINDVLLKFGVSRINWLGQPTLAKISCLAVNLWLGFPYMMLVTTGILQSIPENIYEASAIDGAGKWASFWHITLPMIFSSVGPLLVGSFAFSFNNFAVIYLLNQGLPPIVGATTPAGETDILISYTYKLAFGGQGRQDLGLASSVAVLVFLIITVITLINFKAFGMFKDDKAKS